MERDAQLLAGKRDAPTGQRSNALDAVDYLIIGIGLTVQVTQILHV